VHLASFSRWMFALGLGILIAGAAGAVAWFTVAPTYTAMSIIRIAPTEEQLADWGPRSFNQESYEAYKGTQQEIIRSRFVLTAALRDPQVANLPMIRHEQDLVAFLQHKLSVDLPRNTEVMLVSLQGESKNSVVTLLKAVVDAYIREVVDSDRRRGAERLSDLQNAYSERNESLRRQRSDLQNLVEKLGVAEPQALATTQQLLVQTLGEVRRQLFQVQWEISKIQGQINAQQTLLKAAEHDRKFHIPPTDLSTALNNDPAYGQLLRRLSRMSPEKPLAESAVRGPLAARYARPNEDSERAIQDQLSKRHNEVRDELRGMMRARIDVEVGGLQSQLGSLRQQEQQLQNNLSILTHEAAKLGYSSLEVNLARDEIKLLEEVNNVLGKEKERLSVESRASPRIAVLQPADAPEIPDQRPRVLSIVLAAVAGFLLPVVIVLSCRGRRHQNRSPLREPGAAS